MPAILNIPLSEDQQQQVIEATRFYIHKAAELYRFRDRDLNIRFNLKGRSAGMYRVWRTGAGLFRTTQREIRYNPYIFERHFEDNLKSTVPHEVAHYASDLIYGLKNIKPHGREWKQIMQAFNADASVTASYDLGEIPQRQMTYYSYSCACREHRLSAIRHNRIRYKRFSYYCNHCKQPLQPTATTS